MLKQQKFSGKMACKLLCVLMWILLISISSSLARLSCMDMKGNPVDWFIAYKLPKNSNSTDISVQNGSAFLYMDVNSQSFQQSDVSLDSGKQSIGFTLQQIYSNYKNQKIGYGMYNDQHPGGKAASNRGHTKGVLALDSDTGFWLVHSVPKFPNPGRGNYAWPDNGRKNGQTFLCVTVRYDQFEEIGKQLRYTWPSTYDVHMPDALSSGLPSLVDGLNGNHITEAPWNRTTTLKTPNGQQFLSFAKFTKFNADLYSEWVAPYFSSDMYTETWQSGKGTPLPSSCNMTYKVFNIKKAYVAGSYIKATKDHSKWAVTTNSDVQWVCIGGINRMEPQAKRGGGTVCVNLPEVWTEFYSAVHAFEACKIYSMKHAFELNTSLKG